MRKVKRPISEIKTGRPLGKWGEIADEMEAGEAYEELTLAECKALTDALSRMYGKRSTLRRVSEDGKTYTLWRLK